MRFVEGNTGFEEGMCILRCVLHTAEVACRPRFLKNIKSNQYKPRPHTFSIFSVSVFVFCCQFVRLDLGGRCCMLSTHKLYYADVSCLLSFMWCACAEYFVAIHFRTLTPLCVSNLQGLHTDLYYARRSAFFGFI